MKKHVVWIVLGLILAGCRSASIPTPEPLTAGDCTWEVTAVVYSDDNANGQRDEGEAPMPGIMVGLLWKDTERQNPVREAGETDSEGVLVLRGLHNVCSLESFILIPMVVPAGYAFPEVPSYDMADYNHRGEVLEFGLVPSQ